MYDPEMIMLPRVKYRESNRGREEGAVCNHCSWNNFLMQKKLHLESRYVLIRGSLYRND